MSRRRRKNKRKFRRGVYILPNLFTTASLFAGFYSIVATFRGSFTAAAIAIIISAILDGLDGKVARMTGTTSQFGLEYDSLADLVAFGVAPGILVYVWALKPFGRLGWVVAFLYVTCGALRLARFNVYAPTRNQDFFQGLAIPAAACTIAATVFWFGWWGQLVPGKHIFVLILVFALSFLMVSNFPYFSLKNPEMFKAKPFNTLVAAVLLFTLVAVQPKITLFVVAICYAASGPIYSLALAGRRKQEAPGEEPVEFETPPSTVD
ncbi:MAG: CDP-diacylglycerol--serine O-phosphatidyltransferase [Thermodesulfobacteriota bacterium]